MITFLVDRFMLFSLLLIMALAPLPLGSNRPASWSLVALAVGGLIIAWGLLASVRPTLFRLQGRDAIWPALLWGLVIVWLLFQASGPQFLWHPFWDLAAGLGEPTHGAISVAPFDTGSTAMRMMAYGGIFWLAVQTGRDSDNAHALSLGVLLVGLFYALYGLANEMLGTDSILWFEKWAYLDALTSTFVNRNSFATFAGLSMVTGLGMALRILRRDEVEPIIRKRRTDLSRVGAGLILIAVAIIGVALVLTHSRAGLFSTGVGMATLVVAHLWRWRRIPGWGMVAGGVVLAASVLLFAAGTGTFERKVDKAEAGELGGRTWLFQRTISAIADEPLTGHGAGAFESYFQRYKNADFGGVYSISKAHNSYLEFAADAGIPALILVVVVIGGIALSSLAGMRRRKQDASYPAIGFAATALVALHSLVDFSLQIPAVAIMYATILGIGYAQAFPTGGGRHNRL